MIFEVLSKDPTSAARLGLLATSHGTVETPAFMPVATQGAVKTLSQEDLESLGFNMILSNSYHLYLRPGLDILRKAGGLRRFMAYSGSILTDSGGFQAMSLSHLRTIEDSGIAFRSHLDGSRHLFTPESVIDIQAAIGSDCWTALDVCPPYPCPPQEAEQAFDLTLRWAERASQAFRRKIEEGAEALFFPIVQGGFDPKRRAQAAERLLELSPDGLALGGFSVGEPKELTWEILGETAKALPDSKPRYLMGVGTPEDLWEAVRLGVDLMDCVWPTRVARNGLAATSLGRLSIENSAYKSDTGPLDPECSCFVCRRYSRAYLSHLFRAKELSAYRFLTWHNLHVMKRMVERIKSAIREGRFEAARREFLSRPGST
jgi:queuine tRNA-ribosyltransferase